MNGDKLQKSVEWNGVPDGPHVFLNDMYFTLNKRLMFICTCEVKLWGTITMQFSEAWLEGCKFSICNHPCDLEASLCVTVEHTIESLED
jgi:hypothetical protein